MGLIKNEQEVLQAYLDVVSLMVVATLPKQSMVHDMIYV